MGRILVTGATGQLGRSLAAVSMRTTHTLNFLDKSALDLADANSICEAFKKSTYVGVINTGAYTAVDLAEREPERAWAVNAEAPFILARECKKRSIPLVHVSTDYVFSGTKSGVYLESDSIGPLSVYGASKAAGEIAVTASGARAVIARTSWVVSPFGSNFVKTMLRLGREGRELRVVADQTGAPTSAFDLAEAILTIMDQLISNVSAPTGVYHVTNAGETTWFRLAEAIFEIAALMGREAPGLVPISAAEYPTPARRPRNSRLSAAKLKNDFDLSLPEWQTSLVRVVRELIITEAAAEREDR